MELKTPTPVDVLITEQYLEIIELLDKYIKVLIVAEFNTDTLWRVLEFHTDT